MKHSKLLLVAALLCLLPACGVGEFFIKRTVNGFEKDVAGEFKDYADFNAVQKQQIDSIASEVDEWLRADRLPALQNQIELIASDVESNSRIQEDTWDTVVAFLERPMNMSEKKGLVEGIASLTHSMSEQQAQDTLAKMDKDHKERLAEQKKLSFEKQNKRLTKSLKILFSEMDISRSRAQLRQAKEMLSQRYDHSRENELQTQSNYQAFKQLISERSAPEDQYIAEFLAAWQLAEAGAKYRAPEKWGHNAQLGLEVLNYLLADLSQEQRLRAANKLRAYAKLFAKLSSA